MIVIQFDDNILSNHLMTMNVHEKNLYFELIVVVNEDVQKYVINDPNFVQKINQFDLK